MKTALTSGDEINDGKSAILSLQRMLNHDATQLVLRREILHFAIFELTQQSRLSGTVSTKDSISPSTNESEFRV